MYTDVLFLLRLLAHRLSHELLPPLGYCVNATPQSEDKCMTPCLFYPKMRRWKSQIHWQVYGFSLKESHHFADRPEVARSHKLAALAQYSFTSSDSNDNLFSKSFAGVSKSATRPEGIQLQKQLRTSLKMSFMTNKDEILITNSCQSTRKQATQQEEQHQTIT